MSFVSKWREWRALNANRDKAQLTVFQDNSKWLWHIILVIFRKKEHLFCLLNERHVDVRLTGGLAGDKNHRVGKVPMRTTMAIERLRTKRWTGRERMLQPTIITWKREKERKLLQLAGWLTRSLVRLLAGEMSARISIWRVYLLTIVGETAFNCLLKASSKAKRLVNKPLLAACLLHRIRLLRSAKRVCQLIQLVQQQVTGNTSQLVVSRATEEELSVDSLLLLLANKRSEMPR